MSDPKQNDEMFRRFLDGELEAAEERAALHMIADDEEMRDLLRFERSLYQATGKRTDPDSFSVPAGFTDRVMSELTAADEEIRVSSGVHRGRLRKIFEPFLTPQQIQLRPVYGLAAVLILALLLAVPSGPEEDLEMIASSELPGSSASLISEQEQPVWIRFVYFDDEAESMAVAGDFSDWDPISLDREIVNGRHVWTGLIPVTRGEQRYMFVKDGEDWVTDPLAEIQRDDGFGNKNAVLYL